MKELHNATFCINLKHRTDRWQLFSEEIKKFPKDFNAARFEAVYDPFEPRRGCAQSHIQLIKMAKNSDQPLVLVFEDDVVFVEEPYPKIQAALRNLPNNWDILQFGVYETPIGDRVKENIYSVHYAQCTHCILYNHSVYDHMLVYDECPLGIDDYISYLAATKAINLYHVHPPIAFQRKGFSDIKNMEFDWNSDHHLSDDYKSYRAVFESIQKKDSQKAAWFASKISDTYLRKQSKDMLNKIAKYRNIVTCSI